MLNKSLFHALWISPGHSRTQSLLHLIVSQYFSGEDKITFLNENNSIITISLVLTEGNCVIVSASSKMNSSLFGFFFPSRLLTEFNILKSWEDCYKFLKTVCI